MQTIPAVVNGEIMSEARSEMTPSMQRRIAAQTHTYKIGHDPRSANRAQRRATQKARVGFGSFPIRDYPRLDPAA